MFDFKERDLTPVQLLGDLLVKRDDLYAPFGLNSINGGKLRQCVMLLKSAQKKIVDYHHNTVITGCSVHSPQGAIVAAVCNKLGMNCTLLYGSKDFMKHPMAELALRWGANVVVAPSGRHSVLYHMANQMPGYIVKYGINLFENYEAMLGSIVDQVRNLPEELDNLYITCGSGITCSGVLHGLQKYGKKVGKVHLLGTAPNRIAVVRSRTLFMSMREGAFGQRPLPFSYVDMFNTPGFVYEKDAEASVGGVTLHPNYEAKAYNWVREKMSWVEGKSLFWIVGSKNVFEVG